jgi:hypothetical protein
MNKSIPSNLIKIEKIEEPLSHHQENQVKRLKEGNNKLRIKSKEKDRYQQL